MRRAELGLRQAFVCQLCEHLATRPSHAAQVSLTSQSIPPAQRLLPSSLRPSITRSSKNPNRSRWVAYKATPHLGVQSSISQAGEGVEGRYRAAGQELSSLTSMMAYVESATSKILNHKKLPSEADVSAALQACRVVADYIMDDTIQPQISQMANEKGTAASNLLSLDSTGRRQPQKKQVPAPDPAGASEANNISAQLEQMISKVSALAYSTLAHPTVFITPKLLQHYVEVQARLGRPETLPSVFQLYMAKPLPREAAGSIKYANQNPNKAANSIEPEVVETALNTAIEARNLDAAVGIVEYSYNTTAFKRSKLLRRALVPAATIALTPMVAYTLASRFSILQEAMDSAAATNVAFVGILAYVGFTASIGVVALTTANDQMKRVTWAPGIPLRARWLREEERAALDTIACAWGFSEQWRQGEEEGPEWDTLREYLGQKGMILDRTELMEGME